MAADSGTPSLARRFARGLSRLGLDPEPLFQRARNQLLRPVRHELGDALNELGDARNELAQLRQELAAHRRWAEETRLDPEALLSPVHAQLAGLGHAVSSTQVDVAAQREQLAGVKDQLGQRVQLLEALLAAPPGELPSPAPLVSIVMPTRDRAACLAEAIASVQAQSYPHWELHIVDDGSRDQTRAVVEPFLADPRIRYEAIDTSGVSAARNRGLRDARGEFIAYLDSDNLWFPGFLAAAVAALANDKGSDLLYGVLATAEHGSGSLQLLYEPFDRARLERQNFIDLNAVVHRRALFDRHGGFDESLARLVDWDLLLRYTALAPALALPVLAARYRVRDTQRITQTVPIGPSWLAIQRRVDPAPASPAPRVLYVVWHYPQLSETYIESEIRCLRRWGANVAVWREIGPVSPYASQVPVYEGELEAAVLDFQPDLLHLHWLGFALGQSDKIAALGLPATLRMHGFDVSEAPFRALLSHDWLHRAYAYPHQLRLLEAPDARVLALPSAFDSRLFPPARDKDPRLVLRAGSCLPSKDLGLFFDVAKRLPTHRFVFCGVTCNEFEHYPEKLRRMAAQMESPVELRFDVPREEMAELTGRAGVYLHTIFPPEAPSGAPIGMPISIAEAMATGAYVLVRDLPELVDYVGDAGASYRDAAHAAELIAASAGWSETEWLHRRVRASDRGYLRHADELVLRPILADWQALAQRARAGRIAGDSGTV